MTSTVKVQMKYKIGTWTEWRFWMYKGQYEMSDIKLSVRSSVGRPSCNIQSKIYYVFYSTVHVYLQPLFWTLVLNEFDQILNRSGKVCKTFYWVHMWIKDVIFVRIHREHVAVLMMFLAISNWCWINAAGKLTCIVLTGPKLMGERISWDF